MSFNIEEKRQLIEERIESIFVNQNKSDLLSLDFELNTLISAAQSYKHESVLKPFPTTFLSESNNDKDYQHLLSTVLTLPPVLEWRTKVKKFNKDQMALAYWLLTHKNYKLKSLSKLEQVSFFLFACF